MCNGNGISTNHSCMLVANKVGQKVNKFNLGFFSRKILQMINKSGNNSLFKVKKVFTDRLYHQSTTAPTQPFRNNKALQCPGISQTLWKEAAWYIHVLSYNSSGIVAFCTTSLLILLMHVSWARTSFVSYCRIKEILCQCRNSSICHLTQ